MKKFSAVLKSLLISFGGSLLISFLPMSPLLSILTGGIGAYFFQFFSLLYQDKSTHYNNIRSSTGEKRASQSEKTLQKILQPSDFILFSTINSLINGLSIGYLFTLFFHLTLGKPPEDSWLKMDFVENLLRHSREFQFNFFVISALIAGLMNYLGTYIIFRFGIGLTKPTDEELMKQLKDSDLNRFLEEENL